MYTIQLRVQVLLFSTVLFFSSVVQSSDMQLQDLSQIPHLNVRPATPIPIRRNSQSSPYNITLDLLRTTVSLGADNYSPDTTSPRRMLYVTGDSSSESNTPNSYNDR